MLLADSVPMPECKCLDCGHKFDWSAAVTRDGKTIKPTPGDISICIKCGHIMAFKDDLTVRQLTDGEMKRVAGDPVVISARTAQHLAAKEIK
jgi:Zn ribbon nucleic-acid-binding protein